MIQQLRKTTSKKMSWGFIYSRIVQKQLQIEVFSNFFSWISFIYFRKIIVAHFIFHFNFFCENQIVILKKHFQGQNDLKLSNKFISLMCGVAQATSWCAKWPKSIRYFDLKMLENSILFTHLWNLISERANAVSTIIVPVLVN